MASKGAHTLVEALIELKARGIHVQATMAGAAFQAGYQHQLEHLLEQAALGDSVQFVGQLDRPALARMLALHHVGVFPSIHPEAFGIVGAEMLASGLVLVSSGVGGAGELLEHGISGLTFEAGNALDLAKQLELLLSNPTWAAALATAGTRRAQEHFNVLQSASQLAQWFEPHCSNVLVL
jgi:glycogen(starch) synthase